MKKTIQRHQLSIEEKAEAVRLKAAWESFKEATPGVSQEWLGREAGIGGQSVVSQYLRGDLALNFANLVKFCNVLRIDPSSISPRLVHEHLGDPDLKNDLFARTVDASNRGQKTSLSVEALDLISCVARLDRTAPGIGKAFVLISGLLAVIGGMKKAENTRSTEELIAEAEKIAEEISVATEGVRHEHRHRKDR